MIFDLLFLAALFVVLIQNEWPIVAAGALVICMVRGLAGWIARKRKFRRLEIALILFLAYWLLNYDWSTHSLHNLVSYQFLRRDGALLVTYPAFFCILQWRLKRSYFRAFWFSFLSVLSVIAVCGALVIRNVPYTAPLQRLDVVGAEAEFMGSRLFYGWYHAHDACAAIYTMASVILLALLIEGRLGRKFKIVVWGMLFCCLAGLALTYGRSGYLGFMAGCFVLLPLRRLRRSFKIGLALGVPIIVVLLSNSAFLSRIDTITDTNWGTNANRFVLWRDAWHDFTQSPIVGIGFGRFNDFRRQFEGEPGLIYICNAGEIVNNASTAHDSYLHFLAEGGIVGFFVSMLIWWCAWKELTFFERKLPRSHLHAFHRAGKACLAATLVFCCFDHTLGGGSGVLLLMAIIGLTLAASRAELATLAKTQTAELPTVVGNSRAAGGSTESRPVFSRVK